MPLPNVPTKTPLGQEEQRRRTGGLGQRHRTILFLIDGRRTLAEVLSLAHQAGAATSHFEELVKLGYVELPPEEPPPPWPPEPLPELQITHLELEVPPAEVSAEEAPPAPAAPPVAVLSVPIPVPVPPPPPPPPPAAPPARVAPPPRSAAPAPRRPPPAEQELPLIERTRNALLETLRVDPQPAGGRIAERARRAETLAELIEVVWVMERGLRHNQRSHRGMQQLQHARELLGLGNTLVDEDSRPNRLDDEDDWGR